MAKLKGVYIPEKIYSVNFKSIRDTLREDAGVYGEPWLKITRYTKFPSEFYQSPIKNSDEDHEELEKKIEKRLKKYAAGNNSDADLVVFDNEPIGGWKLLSHRREIAMVMHPNGFTFNIDEDNLYYIIQKRGLEAPDGPLNYPKLPGEYVVGAMYGRKGHFLVPKGTHFYKLAKNFSKKMGKSVSLRSVKPNTLVEAPYIEGVVNYMGGWYFCCFYNNLIFSSKDSRLSLPATSTLAAKDFLNIRRRYISQDEKSLLKNGFQKLPEIHQKFVVSNVVDDSKEMKSKEAQGKVDAIMNAKIKNPDSVYMRSASDYRDGWRALMDNIELTTSKPSYRDATVPTARTYLVRRALNRKPKKFEGKWILEKKEEKEKCDFASEVYQVGTTGGEVIPSGLFFFKHKDYWMFFSPMKDPNDYIFSGAETMMFSNIEDLYDAHSTNARAYKGTKKTEDKSVKFLSFDLRKKYLESSGDSDQDDIFLNQDFSGTEEVVHANDNVVGLFKMSTFSVTETVKPTSWRSRTKNITWYRALETNFIINNLEDFTMYELKIQLNGEHHGLSIGDL